MWFASFAGTAFRPTWPEAACATCCWARTDGLRRHHRRDAERGHAHLSRDLRGGRAVWGRAGADSEGRRSDEVFRPSIRVAIEVATFRSDGIYSDGRHPDQVQYSKSPEEDVQRRDFTINGLLMDPLDGDRVLDFVGGRADLAAGIVRAIGDPERRFLEDKLRMLRAVRFAARFGYAIDPPTFAAIQEARAHDSSGEPRASARRADQDADGRPCAAGVRIARQHGAAERGAARDRSHARRGAAAAVSSRRRRVDPHPDAAGAVAARIVRGRWRGERCCTTSASLQRFAWRPTASASTGTWRWGCAWRTRFAGGCISPTTTPSRSRRWWPTTCASPMWSA